MQGWTPLLPSIAYAPVGMVECLFVLRVRRGGGLSNQFRYVKVAASVPLRRVLRRTSRMKAKLAAGFGRWQQAIHMRHVESCLVLRA